MKFMSEGCLPLTGYRPSDFIDNRHQSYSDLIHPDDRPMVWERVQEGIGSRKPFKARYRIHTAEGEEKWVSEQGVGVFTEADTLVALEGFIIDVTDLVRAEEGLRRLNEELEQRVTDRTRELRQANRALEKSLVSLRQTQAHLVESEKMAALGSLVAGVAHEINTPVGIGVTAASFLDMKTNTLAALLADDRLKRSDLERYVKSATETAGIILDNLSRAADLINSFKQVAVDQTAEECRLFRLREYIENIIVSLRPSYKRTGHTIHVACPPDLEIVSYPGAFSQIISNLVMNSLHHGFDGIEAGRIDLHASRVDDVLRFRYSDNGKGMPPEVKEKIYDPFFTTKRMPDGTGLGMHIVYNLVTQVLNGKITCTSTEGEGTVFNISIPLNQKTPIRGEEDGL
jgi:PAS domain S-box-containing protein